MTRWIASEIGRARRAVGAGAEQRVDHDVGADQARAVRHAELVGDVQHRGGIAAEALARRGEHDPHVETRVAQMARDDEAVSAVVARPADDRHAAGVRVAGAEQCGGARTRDLHQSRPGQARILDHASIQLTQVLGPP